MHPTGTIRRTFPKNNEGASSSYRLEFLGFPRWLFSIVELSTRCLLGSSTSVRELLS
jgi:hypothetical protein